ncbi:MAG: hypothetical protein CMC84_00970, partial [Flavobacteriaceae bacterium]|nr:hypothetical protein [Flavobacteriaceae bacterium]
RGRFLVGLNKFTEETELDEKFTKKDFRDNEDINHHTENGVEIVNMFGTSAEKMKMAGIAARHNMKGSISRKDQQDRDALVKKYYPKLKEEVELDEAKSQGMFIVLEKGSKNKVIGQFKDKKKAIDMMKKNAGSKVIQIGKFATLDDKPVDIKVGDELSYTRVKLSKKIKEEVELDEMSYKPGSFKDTRPQEKGAKAFDKLIQSGGVDKKTFQKAKQLYVQASDPKSRMKLRDFIYNMDTEPTEAVMDLIGRNDPETFVRMYPDADEGERLSTISFRHKQKKIKTEELDDEDIPKVKEIIKKLKGASAAHAGQAKDLEKAVKEAKFSDDMINKLKKAYEPMKGKKINPTPLMKIFDKIDSNKDGLEQLYKADIPFVSVMAMSRLMLKHNYKAADINKLGKIRREEFKESEMTEKLTDGNLSLKETVLKMWQEAVSPAQQAAIAISKKEKEKDEGNAFGAALQAAKEKGEKTFTVAGKEYSVKTEKLVGGQKKLDKNKDGKLDGTDFALLRKSKKEDIEHERQRYLETKRGSLRDAVLKMWGEAAHSEKDDEEKKKNLTKEKKHGTNKMTDTGKEMTPVDMKPKMPKIKNEKNKV